MGVLRYEVWGLGGVGAKNGFEFRDEGGEGAWVRGEQVVDVAEGGGGGVVACEDEEFELRDGEGLEGGVYTSGGFLLAVHTSCGGGEVGVEREVDDGFAALELGGFAHPLPGGEARVELSRQPAVHAAGVVPVDEGAERAVLFEGVDFAAEGEPAELGAEAGEEVVFGGLCVHARVSWGWV